VCGLGAFQHEAVLVALLHVQTDPPEFLVEPEFYHEHNVAVAIDYPVLGRGAVQPQPESVLGCCETVAGFRRYFGIHELVEE